MYQYIPVYTCSPFTVMSVRRREKIFKSDCTVINNPIQTLQNVNKVSLGANKLITWRREDVDIVDLLFTTKTFRWCKLGCEKFAIYFKSMGLHLTGFLQRFRPWNITFLEWVDCRINYNNTLVKAYRVIKHYKEVTLSTSGSTSWDQSTPKVVSLCRVKPKV